MELFEKSLPFLSVFCVICFFSFFDLYKRVSDRQIIKVFYILLSLMLSLVFGLATNKISPDYSTYEDAFYRISNTADVYSIRLSMEIGYIYFSKLISLILNDFNLFLVIFYIAVQSVLYKAYSKLSPYPIISLLLYFCHYYLGRDLIAVRSALSYAIVLFSIVSYDRHRNTVRFFLTILFASLFHITALLAVVLPSLYVAFGKSANKLFKYGFPISLLIGVLLSGSFVNNVFGSVFGFDSIRYIVYIENSANFYSLGLINLVNIKNVMISILFILYFKNHNGSFLLFSFIVGTLGLLAFNSLGIIAGRGLSQFVFIDTILIPILLTKIQPRYIGAITVFSYALIMLLLNLTKSNAYFYESILN